MVRRMVPRWSCGSVETSRSYVFLLFTGSRISSKVLQEFVLEENIESKHVFWASLGLFRKAGFCGCFAYPWTFLNQVIPTHVICYCREIMAILKFLIFHCIYSCSKLLPVNSCRRHLECHYHFASACISVRKTGTCSCHRCVTDSTDGNYSAGRAYVRKYLKQC